MGVGESFGGGGGGGGGGKEEGEPAQEVEAGRGRGRGGLPEGVGGLLMLQSSGAEEQVVKLKGFRLPGAR